MNFGDIIFQLMVYGVPVLLLILIFLFVRKSKKNNQ